MLGAGGGGLGGLKYNNPKKNKKNRRRSYLRKMNERWRTEYEQYNHERNDRDRPCDTESIDLK